MRPANALIDSLMPHATARKNNKLVHEEMAVNDTVMPAGMVPLCRVLVLTRKRDGRMALILLAAYKDQIASSLSSSYLNAAGRDTLLLKYVLMSSFETGIIVSRNVNLRPHNVLLDKLKNTIPFECVKDSIAPR